MENILNNSSSYIGNIKNAIQDFIDKIENLSTNIVNPTSFKLENISNSVKIYYMNDVNVSELLEFANSTKQGNIITVVGCAGGREHLPRSRDEDHDERPSPDQYRRDEAGGSVDRGRRGAYVRRCDLRPDHDRRI